MARGDIRAADATPCQQGQAKVFVFDAVRAIQAVGRVVDLRLENMGRWLGAQGAQTLSIMSQEGGLLLSPSNRNLKIVGLLDADAASVFDQDWEDGARALICWT